MCVRRERPSRDANYDVIYARECFFLLTRWMCVMSRRETSIIYNIMYFLFRRRRLRSCTHILYLLTRVRRARNDRAWACCMGSSPCVRRTCETKCEENENNRNVIIPRLLHGCGAQELTDAAWLITTIIIIIIMIILRSLGTGVTISPKNIRWCGNTRYAISL